MGRSLPRPAVSCMYGRYAGWRILAAALCMRNLTDGNNVRPRSMVVESSAYRSRVSAMPVESLA